MERARSQHSRSSNSHASHMIQIKKKRKKDVTKAQRKSYMVDRIVPGGYTMPLKRLQRLTLRCFGGVTFTAFHRTSGELFQAKGRNCCLSKKKLIPSIPSLFHVFPRHCCASLFVGDQLHNLLGATAVVLSAANHGGDRHRIRQTGA